MQPSPSFHPSAPSPSLSPSIGLLLNPLSRKVTVTSGSGYQSPEYSFDYFTELEVEDTNSNFKNLNGTIVDSSNLKRSREESIEMLPPSLHRRTNSHSFESPTQASFNSSTTESRRSSEPSNGFVKSSLPPPRFNPSTLSRTIEPVITPAIKPPKPRVKKEVVTTKAINPPTEKKVSPKQAVIPLPPPIPTPNPLPTRSQPSVPSPASVIVSKVSSRERERIKLEPSIFGLEPHDEFTREVGDWLWGFCATLDPEVVEIEAKIGVLIDKRGGQRFNLPVAVETIVTEDSGLRFESKMTDRQHQHYNKILNSRVEDSASPAYSLAPIRYSHSREIDSFHAIPGNRKVRITKDQRNGKVINVVEKIRMADMSVFSPKRCFDFRISVNLEQPVATEPDTPPVYTRQKDRISYSHQLFQIDLTQVKQDKQEPTHELEIEFKDSKTLLREAGKEARGEENNYFEMIGIFLNNIRMLIRNAA